MIVSIRRLRAVLLFSTVSAIVWGTASLFVSLYFGLKYGQPVGSIAFWSPFMVFASCGLVAGAIYSVGIAMVPLRDDQKGLSTARSGAFGSIAGALVFLAVQLGLVGLGREGIAGIVTPTVIFGAIGAVTGVAIQRVALRGALPAPGDVVATISAGSNPPANGPV